MRLEDFIKNNRDAFEGEEPSMDHFERFEKRLKVNSAKKYSMWPSFLIAAAMTGLIVSTVFLGDFYSKRSEVCILTGEMKEVQEYYASELGIEMKKLERVLDDINPSVREDVIEDIMHDPENVSDDFCKESDNEKAMAVMVDYYQTKIKTIQSMITFFEEKDKEII